MPKTPASQKIEKIVVQIFNSIIQFVSVPMPNRSQSLFPIIPKEPTYLFGFERHHVDRNNPAARHGTDMASRVAAMNRCFLVSRPQTSICWFATW